MNPFLSVCLIVKNEEKVLRRCLESIIDIADEIIIADTGSSDKSKDIAHKYTKKVYDYKWEDDFSKARNFAASKATGEWIMAIDADEYVDRDSFVSFKDNLKNNSADTNILAVQIVNFIGINGKNTVLNYHDRVYKNDGKIHYFRNIHEMLRHKESLEIKGVAQLQVFHSGYMEDIVKDKNKANRNLELLKNIKNKKGYDYYFLGDVYFQLGKLERAITNYKKAFQLKENINYDWVAKLLVKLVSCLFAAKRNDEALEIISSSEEIYSNLVDFKFLRAEIYVSMGRDQEAINIFENILIKKDELKADSSIDYLEYLPHKFLGELYEKERQLQLAVNHYSKCLSINDADDYIWVRLITLLAKHSSIEELIQFINKNCLKRRTMSPIRIVRILLSIPIANVQKLTRSYLNKSELSPKEEVALLLKNLFLDRNYSEIIEILSKKNINEISFVLSSGLFGLVDLILLSLVTNNENLRNILYNLKFDESILNLLFMLFENKSKKLTKTEENLFIEIMNQAYVMQIEEVVKKQNNKIGFLGIEGKKRLKEMEVCDLDSTYWV